MTIYILLCDGGIIHSAWYRKEDATLVGEHFVKEGSWQTFSVATTGLGNEAARVIVTTHV